MRTLIPYLAILFLLIALALFFISSWQKNKAGIPSGKVIYTDTRGWGRVEKPLFEPDIRLTGKPDYLVEQKGQVIPVEVKSSRAPETPYDSHIYQLAAYCLLVSYEYGQRPDQGIIHYPDKTFAIDFTPSLEHKVIDIIREMQTKTASTQVNRSHQEASRCRHCGYHSLCDQSLRI